MANKHLQCQPHRTTDKNIWWYEEPVGILLVRSDSLPTGHQPHVLIRWSSIRAALRRKDRRADKPRKAKR